MPHRPEITTGKLLIVVIALAIFFSAVDVIAVSMVCSLLAAMLFVRLVTKAVWR